MPNNSIGNNLKYVIQLKIMQVHFIISISQNVLLSRDYLLASQVISSLLVQILQ
jgi:hypothetical protein